MIIIILQYNYTVHYNKSYLINILEYLRDRISTFFMLRRMLTSLSSVPLDKKKSINHLQYA
jgi:hypothetical protein